MDKTSFWRKTNSSMKRGEQDMTDKPTYEIRLNWYGVVHIFYQTTLSEEMALSLAITELAKEVKRTRSSVCNYIYSGDRRLVQKVKRKEVK